MAVVTGAALAAGVAVTLAVPVCALHELIVKRHKHNMKKHFPQMDKKVHFSLCSPLPSDRRSTRKEVEASKIPLTQKTPVSLPAPPYKSVLKRPVTPPPTYEEIATGMEAAVPRPRMNVRFAERA